MPTITFRSGILDTRLEQATPTTVLGTSTYLGVDTGTNVEVETLLSFGDLFGTASTQIPLGATITSATLTLQTTNASTQGGSLHRMLSNWTPQSTWNSFGGNGIQFDGI